MTRCSHSLSIVVIGRDEEEKLRCCLASLESLPLQREEFQIIYVDSASRDGSVETASKVADLVVELGDDGALSASAGRYHGTLQAHSGWILYLDSDMELTSEFASRIPKLLANESVSGIVGPLTNRYPDGALVPNAKRYRLDRTLAPNFGGAVLLPRSVVLRSGNWDPRISSNEEMDLYVRMKHLGSSVRLVQTPIAIHHAPPPVGLRKRLQQALTGGHNVRRSYGFGQVLRAYSRRRNVGALIRYCPEPFLVWAGTASLIIAATQRRWAPVGVAGACLGMAVQRRGARFVFVSLILLVHAVRGWRKLPEEGPAVFRVTPHRPCCGIDP